MLVYLDVTYAKLDGQGHRSHHEENSCRDRIMPGNVACWFPCSCTVRRIISMRPCRRQRLAEEDHSVVPRCYGVIN